MSALLFRLGRNSARHPFRVIGLWLVAAIAIVLLQGAAGGHFDDSFRVPGVESQRAADILTARFPSRAGQAARIVVHVNDGRLDDADHRPIIDAARQQLSNGHDVAGVTDPFDPQSAALSHDGRTAYVDVAYALDKLTVTQLHDAQAAATNAEAGGVHIEFTGQLALLE
jgi:RND superfamily putative drug exporter